MKTLSKQKCQACEGVEKPLSAKEVQKHLKQVSGWKTNQNNKQISREWNTKNFIAAVKFINKVAKLAESENHHPDVHLTSYRNLRIDLSTHKIGGLSNNDFILAAKIDKLPVKLKVKK
jgi:4a-hydroxytetrahydrobiopterin dehydratase